MENLKPLERPSPFVSLRLQSTLMRDAQHHRSVMLPSTTLVLNIGRQLERGRRVCTHITARSSARLWKR